jgi:5'-nucleotidase
VLLIHAAGGQGNRDSDSDPNGCAAFDGGIVPLVGRLSKDVNLVVSGHTHAAYICRIGGRLVTSAASYGRLITRISLEIDPARAREVRAEATNEIVTREVPPDPAISWLQRGRPVTVARSWPS